MRSPTVVGEASQANAWGRVLLIDDERRILDFVSRALRSERLEVDTASDGAAGLQMALAGRYDVVVLDLLMPGMDGNSVLRGIMERRRDQPIIVLSALSDPDSKVDCLDLGADDYLTKPFSLDELIARIRARPRTAARTRPPRLTTGRLTADVHLREDAAGLAPV